MIFKHSSIFYNCKYLPEGLVQNDFWVAKIWGSLIPIIEESFGVSAAAHNNELFFVFKFKKRQEKYEMQSPAVRNWGMTEAFLVLGKMLLSKS